MKYMGSKARIAKDILPIILAGRQPNQYYVEPFVGGANLIDKVSGLRIGNDVNKYLIALLREMQFRTEWPYLSKMQYEGIKNTPNSYDAWLVGYAGICCSYSGKWFGGYAGVVKTKEGIRDYQTEAQNNIKNQKLEDICFIAGDYRDLLIPDRSIIYCDIPYLNSTNYGTKFNHEVFYDWCVDKKNEGHSVYVSEYYMPGYFKEVWRKSITSSLSANGVIGGAKTSVEKLYKL